MKKAILVLSIPLLLYSIQSHAEESEEDTKPEKSEVNLELSESFKEQIRLNDLVGDGGGRGGGGRGGLGSGAGGAGGDRGDGQFHIPPLKRTGPTGGRCFTGYCGGWRFGF